jgi:hypothetical protein
MPRNNFVRAANFMGLPLVPRTDGYYRDILERMRVLFDHATANHHKVFAVRLDLRRPPACAHLPLNQPVSDFTKLFSDYLNSPTDEKPRIDHEFLWACETGDVNLGIHHHVVLWLNGDRTQTFFGPHLDRARELWCYVLGVPLTKWLVHVCDWEREYGRPDMPYVRYDGVVVERGAEQRDEAYQLFFERAAYAGKVATKGDMPPNMRRYASSHLS